MQIPMEEPGSKVIVSGSLGSEMAKRVKQARNVILARARNMRLAWRLVLLGVLISAAALLWLSQTSAIVTLGYEIEKIEKTEQELNRQAEYLNTEIGKLTNLRQIEKAAREKLGMTEATRYVYLEIPSSGPSAVDGTNTNPRLYQVSDWWRIISQMLPSPWRDGLPARPR
jgi:cell division protein FtsB